MGGRRTIDRWLVALAMSATACAGGVRAPEPGPQPDPVSVDDAPFSPSLVSAAPDSAAVAVAVARTVAKPTVAKPKLAAPKPAAAAPRRPAVRTAPPVHPKKPAPARPPVQVDSTALEFAVGERLAHAPLTQAIARRTRNPELAERAAWAVTREAGRIRMSPSLLAAVLLTENRQLDSAAVSSQGAIGLMQVMPIHAGSYGCGSADLVNVEVNICHGAQILHRYLVRTRSVALALRRYNGCVRGANTPRCYRYPVTVLATAGRLRREMLASATEADRRVPM